MFQKWKIAIFLEFFHFLIIFLSCFIIFASSSAKIFRKMENCNFPLLAFFLSFFIIFAPLEAKMMKNYNK